MINSDYLIECLAMAYLSHNNPNAVILFPKNKEIVINFRESGEVTAGMGGLSICIGIGHSKKSAIEEFNIKLLEMQGKIFKRTCEAIERIQREDLVEKRNNAMPPCTSRSFSPELQNRCLKTDNETLFHLSAQDITSACKHLDILEDEYGNIITDQMSVHLNAIRRYLDRINESISEIKINLETGQWQTYNAIAMPPNIHVSEEDWKDMRQYIRPMSIAEQIKENDSHLPSC